jgi:hypothetical protein
MIRNGSSAASVQTNNPNAKLIQRVRSAKAYRMIEQHTDVKEIERLPNEAAQ